MASATKPSHQTSSGLLDLLDTVAADTFGFAQNAPIGIGQRLVGKQRARLRHVSVRQIDRRGGRPMLLEELFDRGDRGAGALDQRMALAGVIDRGRQHLGQIHGAVVAQHDHPGVEHARHAGGKQPGARHHVEPEAAEMRDGGGGRRRPLAADDLDLALAHVVHDHRHVAAGTVQMRFHHLQRERGRDRGVERVAALLQHAHADRGGDPVRRSHDAERAVDLRARGEGIRIDIFHANEARWRKG